MIRPLCSLGTLARAATGASCLLLLTGTLPAAAQEGGQESGEPGPARIGDFVYVSQGNRSMLVVPGTESELNEGARLFFRCSDGRREVYVVSTEDRLGNARDGAGGRYRFDGKRWSDLHQWGSNEQGAAAFLPPRFAREFAGRARDAERVEVEIVNTAGVRHRYVFPLAGFGEGAQRLECFRRTPEKGDGGG